MVLTRVLCQLANLLPQMPLMRHLHSILCNPSVSLLSPFLPPNLLPPNPPPPLSPCQLQYHSRSVQRQQQQQAGWLQKRRYELCGYSTVLIHLLLFVGSVMLEVRMLLWHPAAARVGLVWLRCCCHCRPLVRPAGLRGTAEAHLFPLRWSCLLPGM